MREHQRTTTHRLGFRSRAARRGPVVLMAVGVLVAGCSGDPAPDDAAADPSAGTSTEPTSTEPTTPAPTTDTSPGDDYRHPRGSERLEAGRWAIGRGDLPMAVVDVPGGFVGDGTYLWTATPGGVMGYWDVAGVYADPCSEAGGVVTPGPSVDDLAQALGAQPLTTTTKPSPVTVGGHDGVYLEVTAAGGNGGACDGGELYTWNCGPRCSVFINPPDSVMHRYWILDVDGQRVVFSVATEPGLPAKQVGVITGLVDSVEFVEPT